MFIFYIHILQISYSRALLTFMWIFNKTKKTPTRGIHHPSMMDVHTKVLLSVENEIFYYTLIEDPSVYRRHSDQVPR